ncbi:MAG: hypothetical protein ACQESB_00465 [Elusimicrobiota bacterium]
MVKFNIKEQKLIRNLLNSFNENDIFYVVPRDYEELPKEMKENRLDILVEKSFFLKAHYLCGELSFKKQKHRKNLFQYVKNNFIKYKIFSHQFFPSTQKITLKKYIKTHMYLIFLGVRSSFRKKKRNKKNLYSRYIKREFKNGDVTIRLMSHLAYTSPSSRKLIQVGPIVGHKMLENREKSDDIYIPSPPDELAHLICRGVCDFFGNFPDHYLYKCSILREKVLREEEDKKRFKKLLSILFFKADVVVYNCILKKKYNKIKEEVVKFTGY